jgi:glycosyltransferase involved in cell wall biosynthesis
MSDFDHVRKVNRFGYTKTINIRDNFNVKLISASAYANNISINRIKHNLQLATNFIEEANTQREKPDIIFACLPTLELAENAVLFAKRVGVPIVIDVVDIWPDVYLSAFPKVLQSAGRFILTSEFYRAKRILRNATAITAVSKTYLSWALKHAGRVKKMEDKIFPLGYTICMSVTNEIGAWQEAFKERYKIASDTILVTFIGQFAKSYDLETVIKAASQFTNNHKLKFILAGDGDKVEKLKKMAEGMDNVIFTG